MNYLDLYSSYPDRTITSAWDAQLKYGSKNPWLNQALMRYGDELFARFAACYTELRALPRAARRRLQHRLARSTDFGAALPECLRQSGQRLQHRMAWSLAGAALLLALGQGVATAATITVTTDNPNIAADGQCSLIEAIVNANNDAATFPECPAGSGADIIVLPANTNVTLSAVFAKTYGQFGDSVGLPPITSRITIEGNGATIARQGNAPGFGLIFVKGNSSSPGIPPTPGDLTLRSLTLTGGSSFGGLSNNGTLSIENSIISGNSGGGVSSSGTLTIAASTILGNYGSGVSTSYGNLTIQNSTISGNTTPGGGGGVYNYAGTVAITNSTISDNTAKSSGGGVNNKYGFYGGVGRLTVSNSTISGNRANQGGGIFNDQFCFNYSPLGRSGCLFAALTLNGSLIAGNQASAGPEIENAVILGPMSPGPVPGPVNNVTANNFNLFGTNGNAGVSGFTPGPTDIVPSVSLAQILAPLVNNGGPTQTHALVAGSPAIDRGNPNGCLDSTGAPLPTDQRGLPRGFDGNGDGRAACDIGAFELNAQDLSPAISISDAIVTEGNSGAVNVTFQVNLSAPSSQPVSVTFSTGNRTATAGVDFVGTSGTLTFDPGETTKTITVVVDGNNTLELDKTFVVNLTSATNAFIADGQGVGTIVNDDGSPPQMLANISSRGGVLTGNNVMIGGFIIDGTAPKRVLVRSRGPSMAGAPFFVPGTLANPKVQLFSGPTLIAQNDNWQDAPSCPGFVCEGATEILNTGLDPCTPNPGQASSPANCALEAAILITLPPGPYTAIVSGADGKTGVGLVEVFEADASTVSEMSNISTRGFVQSGDDVMIGGLIIEGSSPATVLIRARGPSMSGAPFFVPGTLANPFLQLFSGQDVIAQNDNWQDAPSCDGFVCGTPAQIAATGLDPCQPNPGESTPPVACAQESAILITLPPGAYTAIVSGVSGGTGVGLVEAFEMD
jgi:Calx-beta domain